VEHVVNQLSESQIDVVKDSRKTIKAHAEKKTQQNDLQRVVLASVRLKTLFFSHFLTWANCVRLVSYMHDKPISFEKGSCKKTCETQAAPFTETFLWI
jgi:hypothetical protein